MTWLPVETGGRPERDAVFGLVPDFWAAFDELLERTWDATDPALLDLCRVRLAQMTGCRHELAGADRSLLVELDRWPVSAAFSDRDRAALDYAEQFHVDQNRLSDEQKDALARHLTYQGLVTFASALQVHDAYIRMLTVLDVEPDARAVLVRPEVSAGPSDEPAEESPFPFPDGLREFEALVDTRLQNGRFRFNRTMRSQRRLDMQTMELCRLLNANHQSCALCMSTRQETDMPDGVDDLMDVVVRWERADLPARQRAAMAVTQAFVTVPGALTAEDKALAAVELAPEQIVEMLLKLCSYSYNKTQTAFGVADALDETKLTIFRTTEAGDSVRA